MEDTFDIIEGLDLRDEDHEDRIAFADDPGDWFDEDWYHEDGRFLD